MVWAGRSVGEAVMASTDSWKELESSRDYYRDRYHESDWSLLEARAELQQLRGRVTILTRELVATWVVVMVAGLVLVASFLRG
jgi:hypothetical protein